MVKQVGYFSYRLYIPWCHPLLSPHFWCVRFNVLTITILVFVSISIELSAKGVERCIKVNRKNKLSQAHTHIHNQQQATANAMEHVSPADVQEMLWWGWVENLCKTSTINVWDICVLTCQYSGSSQENFRIPVHVWKRLHWPKSNSTC